MRTGERGGGGWRGWVALLLAVWAGLYGSWTLFAPPLLDDADSVHAEVAREMLLRHDYVTLYANGIRYLEKAPLYYWATAMSFRVFGVSTAAARVPLALSVLALALLLAGWARRSYGGRAGLYAGLIALSSFGIFIFSRINIPDVTVCVSLVLALGCFWAMEAGAAAGPGTAKTSRRALAAGFGAACALNVLTKGLIGVVFPVAIAGLVLLVLHGGRGALRRVGAMHPWLAAGVFFAIATPWHVLAARANPGHGAPGGFHRDAATGHWAVPLPTDGNVHGWAWFYFVNEQVYRYLNVRVPRDYDTVPLPLFLGLILIWLMPWSAFLPGALGGLVRPWSSSWRAAWRGRTLSARERTGVLLAVWAAVPLLFFSFSTRQEYYVLPALPAMILAVAGWLGDADRFRLPGARAGATGYESVGLAASQSRMRRSLAALRRTAGNEEQEAASEHVAVTFHVDREAGRVVTAGIGALRAAWVLAGVGILAAGVCGYFLLHARAPAGGTDLASLLQQNPGDYALSFGHFLDLNARALGLFRLPLLLAAGAFGGGTMGHLLLRRAGRGLAATLVLAAGACGFLLAAWLGLRTFAPVLSSEPLARQIAREVRPEDLIAIHGEYEAGSTLGFYLGRNDLHICEGRSSNLWYGSFFPDAPKIFETRASMAARWTGPQRIFLWEDPHDAERPPLELPGPVYVVAEGGGKRVLSNRPAAP